MATGTWRHKRLSAVGPIRTGNHEQRTEAGIHQGSQTPFGCWSDQDTRKQDHERQGNRNVTNAFRLLVRSGPRRGHRRLAQGNRGVTNAFRLLVRSGRTVCRKASARRSPVSHKRLSAVGPIRTSLSFGGEWVSRVMSQTPFGCWSDQDEGGKHAGIYRRESVVTNAFRLLVRSGPAVHGKRTRRRGVRVTNAFRLLVRSGQAARQVVNVAAGQVTNAFRLLVRSGLAYVAGVFPPVALESQTPFGCWSDQDHSAGGTDPRRERGHKRLSAVGPIRTWNIIPAQQARTIRASQTPFGCWSDQDQEIEP